MILSEQCLVRDFWWGHSAGDAFIVFLYCSRATARTRTVDINSAVLRHLKARCVAGNVTIQYYLDRKRSFCGPEDVDIDICTCTPKVVLKLSIMLIFYFVLYYLVPIRKAAIEITARSEGTTTATTTPTITALATAAAEEEHCGVWYCFILHMRCRVLQPCLWSGDTGEQFRTNAVFRLDFIL